MEQLGLEAMCIWDASVAGGILTQCAEMPAPKFSSESQAVEHCGCRHQGCAV